MCHPLPGLSMDTLLITKTKEDKHFNNHVPHPPLHIKYNYKLIIDTRTKFYIYTRRAFRLHKTHQ